MKKFINRPEDVVKEMMQGLAVLHSRSTCKVRVARKPPGTSLPLCRLWDQPVNLNASMMCGAKVLNEKICERTNAQDEFKRDA